jgi:hypothetical protein
MQTSRDQAGWMGNVRNQKRSDLISDLPEAGIVDVATVSAGPGHDDRRPNFAGL